LGIVFADYGAMTRHANCELRVRSTAYLDTLLPYLGFDPASVHQVGVRITGLERLKINVLDVRACIGHSPGDPFIMPNHDQGTSRKADTGNVQAGRLQFNLVPDARHAVPEVRIIHQQRPAGPRVRPAQHPIIAAQRQLTLLSGSSEFGEYQVRVYVPGR